MFIVRESGKAQLIGVELLEGLKPCTFRSVSNGYSKAIGSRTSARVDKKLWKVLVNLSAPKTVPSLTGKRYMMIVKDDVSCCSWLTLELTVCLLKRTS